MMREYEVVLDKIKTGLRPYSNTMEFLVECYNMAPAEKGLEPHEVITGIGAEDITYLLIEDTGHLLIADSGKLII